MERYQQYYPEMVQDNRIEPYPQEEGISVRKLVQYETEFDSEQYAKLQQLTAWLRPEEYTQKLEQAHAFTQIQLETMLGERYNRVLSEIMYDLRDGQLYGQNTDEPAIEMFKRGRDYCKAHGSTEHEQLREQAEVDEFEKVDAIMNDATTKEGTMIVNISPPSGRYKHNFYDVYTKKKDGVQLRRYSSVRSLDEYKDKVEELTGEKLPDEVTDMTFKDRTELIVIDPEKSDLKVADDIHAYFHAKDEIVDDQKFSKILEACKPAIKRYINQLQNDPTDTRRVKALFNLILLSADAADQALDNKEDIFVATDKYARTMSESTLYTLAAEPIRVVGTACGDSGGADIEVSFGKSALGPFNTAQYGYSVSGEKATLNCTCPFCNTKVVAVIEGGRITCTNPVCKKSAPYEC